MNTMCTKLPTKMAAGAVAAVVKRAFQTSTPSVCSGGGLDVAFKTNAKPTLFTSNDFMMTKAKAIHSAPKLEANATYEQQVSTDTTNMMDPTTLLRQRLASKGFKSFFKAPTDMETNLSSPMTSSCTNCHKCPNAATCPMATSMR